MSKRAVVAALTSMFYIDICLATTTPYLHIPPNPLPNFFYPIQSAPDIYIPSPYQNDCWGIEADYCWWEPYDV